MRCCAVPKMQWRLFAHNRHAPTPAAWMPCSIALCWVHMPTAMACSTTALPGDHFLFFSQQRTGSISGSGCSCSRPGILTQACHATFWKIAQTWGQHLLGKCCYLQNDNCFQYFWHLSFFSAKIFSILTSCKVSYTFWKLSGQKISLYPKCPLNEISFCSSDTRWMKLKAWHPSCGALRYGMNVLQS